MESIVLIGGGGHCKSVIDVIEQEGQFQIVGIVDRFGSSKSSVMDYPVIGCDDDLEVLSKKYRFALVTVGQITPSELRAKLFNKAKKVGFILPIIISPRAYVSKYTTIGDGSVVMHDALININAVIEDNCIINSKALIEHDAVVGCNCHVSTQSIVNGGAIIGSGTFVGSGAIIREGVSIPENSFIKAGSLVK